MEQSPLENTPSGESEVPFIACHHDTLVLSERDVRLMRSFLKWVDTARSSGGMYGPNWEPSDIDISKSRLFWWVRSGHEPLPERPPTAYSCPWYELITEDGNHHALDMHFIDPAGFVGGIVGRDTVCFAQSIFDVVERVSETELIVGYGTYRFRAFRDVELHADHIAALNPQHSEESRERALQFAAEDPHRGWFLCRRKDLEVWDSPAA